MNCNKFKSIYDGIYYIFVLNALFVSNNKYVKWCTLRYYKMY